VSAMLRQGSPLFAMCHALQLGAAALAIPSTAASVTKILEGTPPAMTVPLRILIVTQVVKWVAGDHGAESN